jgi:hypothetical protein
MSRTRLLTLTAGPLLLVACSYGLTMTGTVRGVPGAAGPYTRPTLAERPANLVEACRVESRRLAGLLGPSCAIVERPPFVLAGDLPQADLLAWHDQLIVPITACLHRQLFERPPAEPVVIVLCADERSYQQIARQLDGRTSPLWYGYYQRTERRLVVNVATGQGTLAHELVHALAHADCPGLPEWFDEGLASLFEHCRFADDGTRLIGLPNWRLAQVQKALQRGELPALDRLAGPNNSRHSLQALDYAHARAVCLYLQDLGLLELYYRRLRASLAHDPGGAATLADVLHAPLQAIDHQFRQWVQAQPDASPPAPRPRSTR